MRYGVLITPPLLYYPTCHMLCIGEMAKRHFKLVSRYISSLSVFNIYTSTSTTPMSTTPYLHSPSSYLTQYQFKHHRCVHSHQLHTTRETTEDRIKWMEANITSNHICERIQVIFQTLHLDVTKHQKNAFDSLKSNFGFSLVKDKSTVANAGNGLFLDGIVASGSVVAIYPGVVYHPGDPSFFPSLMNDYIIKRMDGSCVDGKYWGLSKYMYTSLAMRDGPTSTFDNTWHYVADQNWREKIKSPLSMGQMINNSSSGDPNVTYFEFEFPARFPPELWYLIPNINYGGITMERNDCLVKSIAMVSLRDIVDEELFSAYSWVGVSQNG